MILIFNDSFIFVTCFSPLLSSYPYCIPILHCSHSYTRLYCAHPTRHLCYRHTLNWIFGWGMNTAGNVVMAKKLPAWHMCESFKYWAPRRVTFSFPPLSQLKKVHSNDSFHFHSFKDQPCSRSLYLLSFPSLLLRATRALKSLPSKHTSSRAVSFQRSCPLSNLARS